MGAKAFLVGSVAVNVVLAAVLFSPDAKRETSTPPRTVKPQTVLDPRPEERTPLPVIGPAKSFHWNELESTDFQQYMVNLRKIGCPEETIRDLIVAEVNKLYAPRFATLVSQAKAYEYWKPGSKKSREALGEHLEALRAEKRDLPRTLLGIADDPHEQWANITVDQLVERGRFAFLSPEKQKQVQDILARYDLSSAMDPRTAREQRRQELAQVLSPDELYQFELRDSNAADSVRGRFGQADLTEEEYKKLFDLRKAYENEVGAVADNSDPEKMRKRSEARKLLDAAYKEALGEERLKEINRQQDPGWRSLAQVGQQFNLDQQTLDRAYALQQAAAEQLSTLFRDSNLPRDERRKAVDAINAELQNNMASVLGQDAHQAFQKSNPRVTFSTGGDAFVISTLPTGRPLPGGSTVIITQESK